MPHETLMAVMHCSCSSATRSCSTIEQVAC
eukprot:SAG22_NODE_15470_length_348_cov_0.827309_1_plen_29_part_01